MITRLQKNISEKEKKKTHPAPAYHPPVLCLILQPFTSETMFNSVRARDASGKRTASCEQWINVPPRRKKTTKNVRTRALKCRVWVWILARVLLFFGFFLLFHGCLLISSVCNSRCKYKRVWWIARLPHSKWRNNNNKFCKVIKSDYRCSTLKHLFVIGFFCTLKMFFFPPWYIFFLSVFPPLVSARNNCCNNTRD